MQGRPCSAPAKNVTLVFSRKGKSFRTRTDGAGRYRVALAPGLYAVSTPRHGPGDPGSGLEPRRVSVQANRFARVSFTLDVGLL